ncbi:CUB domain-containing protein 1a [Xyrauchen texanus]|uniref:CUB domain-containing protein 1a n=1 Tax=Xyrauchen texanus TaxID=154827 RepID=UPI0022423326|nr:CUB domain-containing protein 1a [Xyrauchen texanus]
MRMWRLNGVPLLYGILFLLSSVLELTGSVELNIIGEEGTTIHINTSTGTKSACKFCIGQMCQSSAVIKSITLLYFTCSQPENIFTVQISREIVRTLKIVPKDHPAFLKFNRTFTWNLKPPTTKSFQLNFSQTGLRQIGSTDSCSDKHIYTLTGENVIVGRFCQNGPIRQVDLRNVGKMSVEVSGGQHLNMKDTGVSVRETIKSLANIHVVLPETTSTQDFFSPNYPDSVPDSTETMWFFNVSSTYYRDVRVLNYMVPTCPQPKSIPTMKYTWKGRDPLVKQLYASQPSVEPGTFNLSLKNCKMLRPNNILKGLMVHFQITAMKRIKGQCEGDLPAKETLQICVKKKDPKSACVLKSGSLTMDTIIVASGDHFDLNFFDCNKDELELTVNQTIECKEWRNCASTAFPLNFNDFYKCIPGVLKTITWHLQGPENSTVELQSPTGGLQHSLPEQTCNSNTLLNVSHVSHDITVGQFCPQGPIQKIQIRESRIAVTASLTNVNDRSHATNPILIYSFTQEISEHYIFTLVPTKRNDPTLLVTPAWPSAMKPSCTVSWIVNLDPQLKSNLDFKHVSQLKCKGAQTSITVQSINSQKILYSVKKDVIIKGLLVPESFYLNMTNCKSPTGAFRAMMQITLQNNSSNLLAIILSIVGILLVVITTTAICFVLRKKKRNKVPPVSIYSSNQHPILPGLHGVPKTPEEEDPHTYVYIDDTLVYSHLLKDANKQCKEPIRDEIVHPQSGPPLPKRPKRKGGGPITKDYTLVDSELYGNLQGQSTKSGSLQTPIENIEEGNYEIRL